MTDARPDDIRPDDLRADDIETGAEFPSDDLEQQADAILLEDRAFAPRPLRQAVREDAALARNWGRERMVRARGAVEAEPVKASIYALGLGVMIGMLIAR